MQEALCRRGSTFLSAERWQLLICNLKSKLSEFIFYNLRKVEFGNEISELDFSDQ